MPITKDGSPEEESKQRLNSSTSTENTKCSIPELVGGHGPWQYRHWLAFFLASTCTSLYFFSVFPLSASPLCTCINESLTSPNDKGNALHMETNCNSSQCTFEKFEMKLKGSNQLCLKFPEANFISEEDTNVCANVNLVMYAKFIYVMGILFSGVTLHLLMFKFSRRTISLISSLLLFASALAISWAQNMPTFLVLRFVISVGVANIYLTSACSMLEVVGEDYKLLYGLIGHIGWGFAHFLLPLLSWLAQDWMRYSITLSIVPLFLGIVLCFIPESVESFMSKGLWMRAEKIIRKAAWSNGCSTQDIEQFTHNFTPQREQEEVRIVTFSKKEYFQRYFQLILLFFIGFSASFLYFTSIWLTEWVKNARGTYFALAATTEIASTIILLFFTCFFSLKHLWAATTAAASASLLIMYAKPSSDGSKVFSTFPYLLTMFFSSATLTIVLYRALFQSYNSPAKWNMLITCIALCLGTLAAAATDFQKLYIWNPKLFVIYGIPNLTIGASVGFIPDRYFKF